ncbi:Hypothetical_protein [Hexamita inflata]|uniref:Hypothetical_protein n=1 Tax=Hexamita inflata TaxID=28002 RepID=A0AA86TJP4_9EUKA|nr:Hypothetical protein HINF_LOCUS8414 [Hexamita inflata]
MNGTTAGRARVMQVQSPLANISAHDIAISTLWRDGVGHLLRAGSRCLTPVLLSGSAVEPSKAGVRSWSSVCGADTSMANQLVHFRVRDDQCRRSLKEIELLQTALYDSLDVSLRKDLIVSVRGVKITSSSSFTMSVNTCICQSMNHMNDTQNMLKIRLQYCYVQVSVLTLQYTRAKSDKNTDTIQIYSFSILCVWQILIRKSQIILLEITSSATRRLWNMTCIALRHIEVKLFLSKLSAK